MTDGRRRTLLLAADAMAASIQLKRVARARRGRDARRHEPLHSAGARARLVAGVPAGAAAALIPRLRVPCRGFDEGVEQHGEPSGPPEILRMPLHPEAEPRAGTLDRFDHAV